ncbi:Tetracycline resistance protein, class G (TetA(G)) (fragment) [Bradyrhizobium sp. ORS 375]
MLGLGVAAVGLTVLSGPGAWLLAAAGLVFALTGAVGYCPACAIAGIGSEGRS